MTRTNPVLGHPLALRGGGGGVEVLASALGTADVGRVGRAPLSPGPSLWRTGRADDEQLLISPRQARARRSMA